MRRGSGYIALFFFLLTFTPLGEVAKVPMLFSHFKEHKIENPLLDFKDFLNLHYAQEQNGNHNPANDQQLPFKCAEWSSILLFTFLPASAESIFIESPAYVCEQQILFNEALLLPNFTKIFHPPKI